MRCGGVEERLVAFADGELSPGEATFVDEHLQGCGACARLDAALRDVTPADCLEIPPEVLARMHAAVDEAVATAPLAPVASGGGLRRWARWLRRDRDLSNRAALAYLALLAACLGWGLSNWFAVQGLQDLQDGGGARSAVVRPAGDAAIPGDQYRPASFSPDDDSDGWR